MKTRSAAPHDLRFISGPRLGAFRLRFGLRILKYLILRRKYPLFRLGIIGDGLLKTFRLMRSIGLRKVVRMGDSTYVALTTPHYPSRAYDTMVAHGGFNAASAGSTHNRQISTALLAISGICNLHCKHCYEHFNIDNTTEVPIARWKEVIHVLQQRGTSVIVLTGGEPMLRLGGVLELLRSGDRNLSDFHLHTSGQGVTREKACMLKDAGLTAAAVGLDDVDEGRHDALRGYTGSYRNALDALRNFHAAGIFTYVNMCATRELIRSGGLWEYFDLAKSLNVGFIQVLEPRPVGGYLQNGTDALLTDDDRCILMRFVEEGNSRKEFRDHPIIYSVAKAESAEHAGCMMGGLFHFHIDSKGNVNPCVFLPVSFGNIMEESFEAIFARMREAVPRPLHIRCPSLQLEGIMRRELARKNTMPVSYESIKAEWHDVLG